MVIKFHGSPTNKEDPNSKVPENMQETPDYIEKQVVVSERYTDENQTTSNNPYDEDQFDDQISNASKSVIGQKLAMTKSFSSSAANRYADAVAEFENNTDEHPVALEDNDDDSYSEI